MAGGFLGLFGGNQGTPAQVMTTNPYDQMSQGGQSGNFGDLANSNSTYLADMFSQLGTGRAPSYYQSYQNQAQPYMQNLLNQNYYGTPGNRMQNGAGAPSGMGDAMTMASMFGLNPKATTGLVNKNNLAYQNASNKLDQYFAGQGLDIMNKTANSLPGWATGQQDALTQAFRPDTTMIPGQAGSAGALPGLLGAMGQGGMFAGLPGAIGGGLSSLMSNMFSGKGQQASLAQMNQPSYGWGG